MELESRRAAAHQRTVRNAWVGSMAGLLIYLLLPRLVGALETTGAEPYRGFRVILWLVAAIQVAVHFWWTRRYVSREAVVNAVRKTAIDPLTYFMAKKIAAIGMAQSVAVYGLVLAFIGGYFWDQYILTLTSAALLTRHYPYQSIFDELEKDREKAETLSIGS